MPRIGRAPVTVLYTLFENADRSQSDSLYTVMYDLSGQVRSGIHKNTIQGKIAGTNELAKPSICPLEGGFEKSKSRYKTSLAEEIYFRCKMCRKRRGEGRGGRRKENKKKRGKRLARQFSASRECRLSSRNFAKDIKPRGALHNIEERFSRNRSVAPRVPIAIHQKFMKVKKRVSLPDLHGPEVSTFVDKRARYTQRRASPLLRNRAC